MTSAATFLFARGAGIQPAICPQPESLRHGRRSAFTLTEVLVIITIIVLMLGMAVPLFNVFTTGRGVDAAQNVISAALHHACACAVGVQEDRGLFFFIDPATSNLSMVTVLFRSSSQTIDIDPQADDVEALPSGIGIGFVGRQDARSTGTGTVSSNTIGLRPVGLVMFDGFGRIEVIDYTIQPNDTAKKSSTLISRTGVNPPPATLAYQSSQVSMILYEMTRFNDLSSSNIPAQTFIYDATQMDWINNNGTAIVINRYNGTLFRGEGL